MKLLDNADLFAVKRISHVITIKVMFLTGNIFHMSVVVKIETLAR